MLYKNIKIYTNGQTDRHRNLLGVPAFVKAFAKAMELHSYLLLSLTIIFPVKTTILMGSPLIINGFQLSTFKITNNFDVNGSYRTFQLVIWSSIFFATTKCYWLKQIMRFILVNYSCCLQKQMKIELQVERLYSRISYPWRIAVAK